MSTESNLPLVLVVGATGAQGGSVARHLKLSGKFRVRGLTRNPKSPKSAELSKLGVEMVQGDLTQPETLKAALSGVDMAFLNTTQGFMEKCKEDEVKEGKAFVDAILKHCPTLKHLVFSTLPIWDANTPNAEGPKAVIEQYIKDSGIPYSLTIAGFYFENWTTFNAPNRWIGGKLFVMGFPTGGKDFALPYLAIEDYGAIVLDVFLKGPGQHKIAAFEWITFKQGCAALSKVFGQTVEFAPLDFETMSYLPLPEVAMKNLKAAADFPANYPEYMKRIPAAMEECRAIHPDYQHFDRWCDANKEVLKAAKPPFPSAIVPAAHFFKFLCNNMCCFLIMGSLAVYCSYFR